MQPVIIEKYVDYGDILGTGQYYYHPKFPDYAYTDGVRNFAKTENAYWLLEAILTHIPHISDYDWFYVFYCHVENNQAVIFGQRDSHEPITVFQNIPYTDLQNDARFWFEHGVLITPNEH